MPPLPNDYANTINSHPRYKGGRFHANCQRIPKQSTVRQPGCPRRILDFPSLPPGRFGFIEKLLCLNNKKAQKLGMSTNSNF